MGVEKDAKEVSIALRQIIEHTIFLMKNIRAHSTFDRYSGRIKDLEELSNKLGEESDG